MGRERAFPPATIDVAPAPHIPSSSSSAAFQAIDEGEGRAAAQVRPHFSLSLKVSEFYRRLRRSLFSAAALDPPS